MIPPQDLILPETEVPVPQTKGPTGPDYSIGSPDFKQVIKNTLGMSENAGRYNTDPNVAGAMGKYQFIPARLQELGYGGIDQYSFTPQVQEEVMDRHLDDLLMYAKQHGMIDDNSDPALAAAYLWAGHLGGKGGMNDAHAGRTGASDAFGTSVRGYFNKGANKFKLAQQANALTDKQLTKSNTGTEMMLEGAGNITPSTSAGEMFSRAYNAAYESQNVRVRQTQTEVRDEVVAQAKKDLGVDLEALMAAQLKKTSTPGAGATRFGLPVTNRSYSTEDQELAFDKVIKDLKDSNPDFKPKYNSTFEISKEAGARIAKFGKDYEQSAEAATFSQTLSGIAGSIVGFMRDPINAVAMIATAPLGPTGMGVKAAIGRAGVNAASEIPVQAALQPENEKVGLPSGVKEGAKNVAMVGLGSLGLDGIVQGVIKGFQKAFSSGPAGMKTAAKVLQTGEAGNPDAPIQSRTADTIGKHLEDTATILDEAPNSSSVIARQNFIEKLDTADTQATLGKPVDVIPEGAPSYVKPLKEETVQTVAEVTKDFTPEEYKAMKADTDEWNEFQQRMASGTEEDAGKVVAEAQDNPPARQQIAEFHNEKMASIHTSMEAPEYRAKIESEFDSTIAPLAENLDASINVKKYEIEKLQKKITQTRSALDNWDQIENDLTIREHLRNDVARQHASERVYRQEAELKTRQAELESLQKMKEEQLASGMPQEETNRTILIEDSEGNVVPKSSKELIEEVQTQRTLFSEFADCIKRGGA